VLAEAAFVSGNIISEGLAEFSALMLLHHEKGDAQAATLRTALEVFGFDCASHFCAAARDMDGALLHCTCETMHAIINAVEESQ
jgi:hypothetical protein